MQQELNLGVSEAQICIQRIQKEVEKKGEPVVIVVTDSHGELIALLRMDGARLPAITIAMNKAFTAARERKPTFEIGKRSRDPETAFDIAYYGDHRFVGWGGGIPVFVDGNLVGAVAVSGLPQQEDMAMAQLGVDAILQHLSANRQ
jgi:glc operon protein GlcG